MMSMQAPAGLREITAADEDEVDVEAQTTLADRQSARQASRSQRSRR